MAWGIYSAMPIEVVTTVTAKDWPGEPLISFQNMEGKPSVEDLSRNVLWLLPFVKDSPTKARKFHALFVSDVRCHHVCIDS